MQRSRNVSGFVIKLIIFHLFFTAKSLVAADAPALTSAVIRGSTVYEPSQLFATYRDQLGQPITSERARLILAALQELYQRDGYSRPELKINDALIARGILRIDVFESRIADITIKGSSGPYRERVEQLIAPLRDAQPIRQQDIRGALQRLRELPGLTVTAQTHPHDSGRNAHTLDLQTSFKPISTVVQIHNRGSEETGRSFALTKITANGLLAQQEKVGLLMASAGDFAAFHGFGLTAEIPVGSRQSRISAFGFRSQANPSELPLDLPDEYLRDRLSLRLTHSLQSTADRSFTLSGALDFDDLTIHRDQLLLRADRLRVLEVGAKRAWGISSTVQHLAAIDVRHGLDALDSKLYTVGFATDIRRKDFLLTRMQLARSMRFGAHWSWRADALGQYSQHVLPYTERFKIGGTRLGRGLEVPEIAGDRGAGAKVELRRELPELGPRIGKVSTYSFYDYGAAWRKDRPGSESASTAGLGVALQHHHLIGYLELAQPLTYPAGIDAGKLQLFAELNLLF